MVLFLIDNLLNITSMNRNIKQNHKKVSRFSISLIRTYINSNIFRANNIKEQ